MQQIDCNIQRTPSNVDLKNKGLLFCKSWKPKVHPLMASKKWCACHWCLLGWEGFFCRLSQIKRWPRLCRLAFSPLKVHTSIGLWTLAANDIKMISSLPAELIKLSSPPQRLDGCGINISLGSSSFWMQYNTFILSWLLLGKIHKHLQGQRNKNKDLIKAAGWHTP